MKVQYVTLIIAVAAVAFFFLGRATLPTFEKELEESRALVTMQQEIISQQAESLAELKDSFREFSEKLDKFAVQDSILLDKFNRRIATSKKDYKDFITDLERIQSRRDSLREEGKKFDL